MEHKLERVRGARQLAPQPLSKKCWGPRLKTGTGRIRMISATRWQWCPVTYGTRRAVFSCSSTFPKVFGTTHCWWNPEVCAWGHSFLFFPPKNNTTSRLTPNFNFSCVFMLSTISMTFLNGLISFPAFHSVFLFFLSSVPSLVHTNMPRNILKFYTAKH